MTFEEFFKKKKIDLAQLSVAEPVLFAEFEAHYAVMGEKSFDHTKKYLFNSLRRIYHTAEEVKAEKIIIENRLAEQTVIDSVTNEVAEEHAPKVGFKPRFKTNVPVAAEILATPAEEVKQTEAADTDATPKLGFKPKFRTASQPKVVDEATVPAKEVKPAEETPAPVTPKLGFKPKFKAAAPTKVVEESIAPAEEVIPVDETPAPATPKLGFKPKFKAAVPPKVAEESVTPAEEVKPVEDIPAVTPAPKLGFKPKFKPKTE
ncbi:hypothetical protein KXQ82_16100 [Mucilaginibacter sp. HMF5004]|uniref:hypothetical protein n=1 Tax=Mucilaginibacter rivuli TaxID=2857527 RepID=UPI001C5D6B8F|nr:hypothetical protein [Mucilaginibacter rivuli]MBW4891250.1 hypothetical protein [Mucilaginibacter rivuli]